VNAGTPVIDGNDATMRLQFTGTLGKAAEFQVRSSELDFRPAHDGSRMRREFYKFLPPPFASPGMNSTAPATPSSPR
jgi:hypothetical protein